MFTKFFNEINKGDVDIAGGKGASLGEMTQAGIPVPPGFVVLADAFDYFLEKKDLIAEVDSELAQINFEDPNSVEETSERLRGLIEKVEMPEEIIKEVNNSYQQLSKVNKSCEFVAVRSSATAEDSSVASWAGELESYLYTTNERLINNIKKCWSSLFTPRALFYRHEKGLHKSHVSVAVVVQKMIGSEISGITFTVHPVTKDKNQMIIEAAWGLGEAIVGGIVTPDDYIINKSKIEIEDISVNSQEKMIVRKKNGGVEESEVPQQTRDRQKLSKDEILALAKICLNIENHYNKPQDIEWALEAGKFYIVQSRPITTL